MRATLEYFAAGIASSVGLGLLVTGGLWFFLASNAYGQPDYEALRNWSFFHIWAGISLVSITIVFVGAFNRE